MFRLIKHNFLTFISTKRFKTFLILISSNLITEIIEQIIYNNNKPFVQQSKHCKITH